MLFRNEDIVDLSHKIISGKENFEYKAEIFDATLMDPNAIHGEDVWYIATNIKINSHVGTHVEVPYHHQKDGADCAAYPLENLIGEAIVINATGKKAREPITLEEIRKYEAQMKPRDMIFFRTDFDLKYREPNWEPFPYIDEKAVIWLLENINPKIIGTDASGIEMPGTNHQPNHTRCFANNTAIIESLTNLKEIEGLRTTVFVLVNKFVGVDASAVRVVAIKNL